MSSNKFAVMVAGMAQQGMEDYVQEYLQRLMEHSQKDPGCLTYNIHKSLKNPNEFMMYSVWESEAAFNEHNMKPEMQEFKKKLTKEMFDVQSGKTHWELLGQT